MSHAPKFEVDRTLFPFESRYAEVEVEAGTARVHYVDEGKGPVLLLLHGNPTWSFLYRKMIPRLSKSFRCIAPDYPGFGLSVAPEGYGYTPREHSAVVEALVDHLGLRGMTVMVQDWGGPVGLGLAGRRPELVERLVIGNTFAWPLTGSRVQAFSWLMGGPIGRAMAYLFNGVVRFFMKEGVRSGLSKAELAMYLAPFSERAARRPSSLSPWLLTRSQEYLREVEANLARIADRPALLTWGLADFAFREPERKRFEAAFNDHRVLELPGSGHFVQEDAAPEICEAIETWAQPVVTARP